MHLPNNTLLLGSKYRIIRFISAGGFGCTYEAIHVLLNKRVAIKELFVKDVSDRDENTLTISAFSTNKSALLNKVKRKFLEEAGALKAMSHPNIVKVFDSFEENGTAYYVMDYIEGYSLQDIIKRNGALPEQKAIKYIKQVANALEYVHGKNRLHLDIKPGNIMIDKNDNAILIDFGVSKQYDEANGESTSTVLGKAPGYSPIEQLGNNIHNFTPATDIYALGATLYKCVTGNTPPDATTVLTDGLPLLPSELNPNTKEAITEAMKPKSTERPQSISQFLNCLAEPKILSTQNKQSKNNNLWIWFLVIGLILVLFYPIIKESGKNNSEQNQSVNYDSQTNSKTKIPDTYNSQNVNRIQDEQQLSYSGEYNYDGKMIHNGKIYPFRLTLSYDNGKVVSGHYTNNNNPEINFPLDTYYQLSGNLVLYNKTMRYFNLELKGDINYMEGIGVYMEGIGRLDDLPEQKIVISRK